MTHPNQAPSPSDIRQEDVRELLPCPFCGQKPFERWEDNINGPKCHHFVWCENLDCGVGGEAMEETKEEAHRKWNTRAALSAQTGEPDWKFNCLSALKLLHEALDVIEDIDSECLLPGQLKDRADAAIAPRQNAEPPYASPPPQPDAAPSPLSTGEVRELVARLRAGPASTRDLTAWRELAEEAATFLSQPPATEQPVLRQINWSLPLETSEDKPRLVKALGGHKGAVEYVDVEIMGGDDLGSHRHHPAGKYCAEKTSGLIRGTLAVRNVPSPATEQIRREVIEECAKVTIELTLKHGKATGTDYEQGVQDHGYRLLHQIRALAATEQARSHEDSEQEIKP